MQDASKHDAAAGPRRRNPAGPHRTLWVTVGIVVWLVAPLMAVAVLGAVAARLDLVGVEDAWVAPEAGSGELQSAVGVQLSWAAATDLLAPNWSGTVQEVMVAAGDTVESGQPIVRIDGIARWAVASSVPITRPLARGDGGVDAAALNAALETLGFTHGQDDSVTANTIAGVRELAERLGVPSSDQVSAFDPAWFIFMPTREVVATAVDLRVGAVAPAPGAIVVATPATIASATLVSADDVPAQQELDTLDVVPVLPEQALDESETLSIAGGRVTVDETRTHIAAESLEAVRMNTAAGAPFILGQSSRSLPPDALRLPVAAVITDSDGSLCVRARESDSARAAPIAVSVVASDSGNAWVTGDLTIASQVQVSPRGSDRSCQR